MKKTLKKTAIIFRLIGSLLALVISFIIGLIDRVILLFIPWKESPNLFGEKYYQIQFPDSFMRVTLVALVVGIVLLVRFLIGLF